jgi:type IV pilus assembly protein PilA
MNNAGKGYPIRGRRVRGFTLIELMIAIAIVAILVALAVPAYRDYTIRSKIAECVNGAAIAKLQVSEYRQSLGAWPPSQDEAGISSPSGVSHYCAGFVNYVSANGSFAIDVDEAAVDPAIATVQPLMFPTSLPNNGINWDCRVGATDAASVKYLPSTCKNTN